MNISSIVVIPQPSAVAQVTETLRALDGVEVAAVSPEGRIIAVLEAADDTSTTQL